MPLLTAIDEYDSTIQAIAAHAETVLLSKRPLAQEAALQLKTQCFLYALFSLPISIF